MPSLEEFARDQRSPLARLLGAAPIAHKVFEMGEGRLAGKRLAVRWITAEQKTRASVDAVKFLCEACGWDRQDLFTPLGESVLDLETKVRMLAVGLVDPDNVTKPLAKDVDELRALLGVGEIDALFRELSALIEQEEPFDRVRTWEEVEGFVTALGKGWTLPRSWSSFGNGTLRFTLRELAYRLYGPATPSSSDTTPPSDSGAPSSATPGA